MSARDVPGLRQRPKRRLEMSPIKIAVSDSLTRASQNLIKRRQLQHREPSR